MEEHVPCKFLYTESSHSSDVKDETFSKRLRQFTNPKYDFIADGSSGTSKRYLCKIKYWDKDKSKYMYMDSAGYYSSKSDARECAANRVLTHEQWL